MSDKKIEEEELPRSRIAELGRRAPIFVISLAVILVVWYFYSINTNPIIFATPQKVLSAMIDLFEHHNLFGALLGTLWLLLLGFGLSVVTGIPIGLTMGRVKLVNDIQIPT